MHPPPPAAWGAVLLGLACGAVYEGVHEGVYEGVERYEVM